MSRVFKIDRDPNDIGCKIFGKSVVELNPGLTVLVGCNGAGKTTMMNMLKYYLDESSIPVLQFNNLQDGGHYARSYAAFRNDWSFVGASMCASEGENIMMNLENFVKQMISFMKQNRKSDEIWFLLDAVDSGASVDNIVDLRGVIDLTIQDNPDKKIYFVVSANEYEMCRGAQCFDVNRCAYSTFRGYESYRNFILKSRDRKNNRKYKEGR